MTLEHGTGTQASKTPYICAECGENDIHIVAELMDDRRVYCPECDEYVGVLEWTRVTGSDGGGA